MTDENNRDTRLFPKRVRKDFADLRDVSSEIPSKWWRFWDAVGSVAALVVIGVVALVIVVVRKLSKRRRWSVENGTATEQ